MLVGVVGGELSFDSDSLGSFRFLGGATASLIVGESKNINAIIRQNIYLAHAGQLKKMCFTIKRCTCLVKDFFK